MRRTVRAAAMMTVLALLAAGSAMAQEWTPPSREMPAMPGSASLQGAWRGELAAWFRGADEGLDRVRAVGEGGGARPQLVRFMGGSRPVATWTDRNGDGRADLIEVFRGGAVAYQLIDADYDGHANVLRTYDASGALVREQRY
jgi:hypothetical protein